MMACGTAPPCPCQGGTRPLLDAILSVEAVGVYKPHPKVYQSEAVSDGFAT